MAWSRISPFLALLLPLACIGRVVDVEPGQLGGTCRQGETPCDPGLECSAGGFCYDADDPCASYGCGEGTCRVEGDTPFCECPAGSIHAEGSAPCRAVSFELRPPPGKVGGLCLAPDGHCEGELLCNREENFCFQPEDPCVGFACGGTDRGRCEPMAGQPACLCFAGFENESFALYCCPFTEGIDIACDE